MRRPIFLVIEAAVIIMIAIAVIDALGLDLDLLSIITKGADMVKGTIAELILLLKTTLLK